MKLIEKILNLLPENIQIFLFDIVFLFLPIKIIKKIPCSYSAYLNCYSPKKGDIVIDCGAHIGNNTVLFSRMVGDKGKVIALEPLKHSYILLKKRINKLKLKNVTPLEIGLWKSKTELEFTIFENNTSSVTLNNENNKIKNKIGKIKVITIDDLIKQLNLSKIDFIKMDIEGSEIEVLMSSNKVCKKIKPRFAIASYHIRDGKKTFLKIEEILSTYNYDYLTFNKKHLTTCGKPKK